MYEITHLDHVHGFGYPPVKRLVPELRLSHTQTKWIIALVKPMPRDTLFKGASRLNKEYIKFLNTDGNFSKFSAKTWLFGAKKDAEGYCSDSYNWGWLLDYVAIVKVRSIENITPCTDSLEEVNNKYFSK